MTLQQLVAPCGMNCALCQAYQGKGLACNGCGHGGERKACQNCSIRNCENKKAFCFECANYPCSRLKALDKRYRTKYRMSMLENLALIRAKGLEEFVRQQEERYRCSRCGKLRTVHQDYCIQCAEKDKARRWICPGGASPACDLGRWKMAILWAGHPEQVPGKAEALRDIRAGLLKRQARRPRSGPEGASIVDIEAQSN